MQGQSETREGPRQATLHVTLPVPRIGICQRRKGKRLLRDCAPVGVFSVFLCAATHHGVWFGYAILPGWLETGLYRLSIPVRLLALNGHGLRLMGRSPHETGLFLASCQIPTLPTYRNSGGHLCTARTWARFAETQKRPHTHPGDRERPLQKRKRGNIYAHPGDDRL